MNEETQSYMHLRLDQLTNRLNSREDLYKIMIDTEFGLSINKSYECKYGFFMIWHS
jgi:hypothetical protein